MLEIQKALNLYRLNEYLNVPITLRDLIKWGLRKQVTSLKRDCALEGYCILAERMRDKQLKTLI